MITPQPQAGYAPAPIPPDEAERLNALRRYQILDTPPDPDLDDLTRIAAALCGTPIALISLVDRDRQWFKAKVGIEAAQTGRAESFCGHAVAAREPLVVSDAAADPRFADNPLVQGAPHIRFYCGIPLFALEGQAIGTICVIDRRPRALTPEQLDGLQALARQIMHHLGARRTAHENAERLRTIVSSGHLGTWEWDIETDRLLYSEGMGPLFGLLPGQGHLDYADFLKSVHPDDRGLVSAYVNQAREQGAGQANYRVIWPDGSVHWLEDVTRVLRNREGRVARLLGLTLDVTRRKQAEAELARLNATLEQRVAERAESLRAREEQYRSLVDSVEGVVWEADAATLCFTFVSHQAEQLLGYPIQRWYEPDFWPTHLHPADRDEAIRHCLQETQALRPHEIEYRMIAADGKAVWLHDSVAVVAVDGKPVRLRGLLINVTARKQAEEALRESEQRLQLAAKATQVVIWDWDVAADAQTWNESGANVFGWTDITRHAQTAAWWVERVHPDDRGRVAAGFHAVLDDPSRTNWQDEYRFRRQRGDYAFVLDYGYVVRDAEGKALRMIGAMLDITERKQADAARLRFLHAINHSMEGLALLDAEGRYTYMNAAHASLYGYRPEELLGKSWKNLYSAEWVSTIETKVFPQLLAEGRYRGEFVGVRKSGETFDVEVSLALMPEGSGAEAVLSCTCHDITERKLAEAALSRLNETLEQLVLERTAALQASEERLAQAVRAANLGFFDHDQRTDRVYWSHQMHELLGVPVEATPSLSRYLALIHPDDRAEIAAAVARAHDPHGDGLFTVEHRILRPDGVMRWVNLRSRTFFEGEGSARRPIRTIGAMADITEPKRAEAAIRASEAQLRLSLEASGAGCWSWDISANRANWDARYHEMYGFGPDEPIAIEAWLLRIHPEDRARIQDKIRELMAMATGETWNEEFRVMLPDGQIRWMAGLGRIERDAGGRAVRFVGINLDITDRKQVEEALRESEERFALAIRGTRDGIWDWNLETSKAYHSPRWKELLGYGADDDLPDTSHAFFSRLHPDDVEQVRTRVMDGVAKGHPVEFECRLRHRDGTYRWILSRGAPVLNAQGRTIRMAGAISDITQQKQAEAEIFALYQAGQRTTRQLQELSRRLIEVQEDERRRLARDLHDEMGQSLSALKLALNKLRRQKATGQDDRLIEECAGITGQMLDEVRRLSRELRPPVLDDLGLAAALEWQAEQQASRSGWALTCRIDPGLSRCAPDVEITCFRILQEALTNVMRHARAHAVTVSLRAEEEFLRLSIIDDGIGFQIESAGQLSQKPGSYGLMGMRERAELVGGRLRVYSQPGQGTEVDAWFPIEQAHPVDTSVGRRSSR